jgi:hypothetical protein
MGGGTPAQATRTTRQRGDFGVASSPPGAEGTDRIRHPGAAGYPGCTLRHVRHSGAADAARRHGDSYRYG